MPGFRAADFND